jgi:hypothetical protein
MYYLRDVVMCENLNKIYSNGQVEIDECQLPK